MKKTCIALFLLGTILSAPLALVSCGGGSDDPIIDQPGKTTVDLKLRSASIAEGATVKASATTQVILAYNNIVSISPSANITLNGNKVQATLSQETAMKVVVSLGALADGTSYKLNVPAGSIISLEDGKTTAPDFTLNFKTEEGKQIDITKIGDLTNKNATKEAKNVYQFLKENYGKKQLTGVQSSMSNTNDFVNNVYAASGKHPALAGYDFIFLQFSPTPAGWSWVQDYSDISAAKEQWENNGLVSYMWHWNVPNSEADFNNCVEKGATDNMGFYCPGANDSYTTFDIREALKEGTWQNRCIMRDIEEVAGYLKNLQDANIPVIFRPLHEAAGNYTKYNKEGGAWFWWGRYGAEPCKKLFRLLHDQLTNVYGLNNLIWVWTIDATEGMEDQAKDWYPGDDIVDIVGVDIYTEKIDVPQSAQYDFMNKVTGGKKLTTISECGNIPDPTIQMESGLNWSWFMVWPSGDGGSVPGDYQKNTANYWKLIQSSQYILSREDMPSLK